MGLGPRFTNPDNPKLPPVSLVKGKSEAVIDVGATFTNTIAFKNNGDHGLGRPLQLSVAGRWPAGAPADSLSTDGYDQLTKRLELYGKFSLRFNANGQPQLPFVSRLTFMTQARAQYLLTRRLDWAIETRLLFQPSSRTMRTVYGTELGFWALPDLRLGGGYNFTGAKEPAGSAPDLGGRGFYFTISSELANLFDLFGTSRAGLASSPIDQEETQAERLRNRCR